MQKGVEISSELQDQIGRNVKRSLRDEVIEEAREVARATARQAQNEVSAEVGECINAMNYRLAMGEKRHSDGLDELKEEFHVLREVVTKEVVAKEPEQPAEEEKPEKLPLIGRCVTCGVGFDEEDKKANFNYCPRCGRDIQWDIPEKPTEEPPVEEEKTDALLAVCCNTGYTESDLMSGRTACAVCGCRIPWNVDKLNLDRSTMDTAEGRSRAAYIFRQLGK